MITKKELVMLLAGFPDHAGVLIELPDGHAELPLTGVGQYSNAAGPECITLFTKNQKPTNTRRVKR